MAANPRHYWTAEEFLAFEADSEFKHELIDGEVYDMSGGTFNHSRISANIIGETISRLTHSNCVVNTSDMLVRLSEERYVYPDMSVVCGQALFEDDTEMALLNPVLVVEVTSPTSMNYDRGLKRESYLRLPSVQAYLIIDQHRICIELYERADVGWRMQIFTSMDDVISLEALAIELPLSQVYRGIHFDGRTN